MNQTDVSSINSIFTPPSTPVSLEGDQHEQDFNQAIENEFIQEKFRFCKGFETAVKTATTNTTTTTSI